MFPRTKNRKAISTVLTTLIILVASVVLGTGVVLYGTSLFQTGAQSKAISSQGVQVWVDSTQNKGYAWGAAAIRNSGDKLLSVDTISVRGTPVPFSNWYFDSSSTRVTTQNFQAALNYTGISNVGKILNYTGAAAAAQQCAANSVPLAIYEFGQTASSATTPQLCMSQATGPISLQPGAKVVVYFRLPDNVLTTVDAGSSSSVAIYAGQVGAPQTVTVASK